MSQKVYLFAEDLGDGSSAVRFTRDPELLHRLQDDSHEYCDYFQQNEGYSRVLDFPDTLDLETCGFDFYKED